MGNVPIGSGGQIWGMLRNLESNPWKQLGEFIDNSLSSWMSDEDDDWPLQIDIIFEPDFGKGPKKGRLIIKDNALGISEKNMERAFEIGNPPTDLDNPRNMGQFGVGMKVAACWFGDTWKVETTAIDEPLLKTVKWNLDEVIDGKLSELPVLTKSARPDEHFTKITITDLNHSPDNHSTIGKIKRFIPKMFRKYLETGNVTITWNGEVLTDQTEAVLSAPWYKDIENEVDGPKIITWETDFDLKLGSGLKLHTYACLYQKFDKQHTGLNLFWKNRLIQGNIDPFHRPARLFGQGNSFRTGRLYIEVLCDNLKITNNHAAIDWGMSKVSEAEFLEALYVQLRDQKFPILQQAENYRNPEPLITKTRVDTTLDFAQERANEFGLKFIESEPVPASEVLPDQDKPDFLIADRIVTHIVDGSETTFRVACVTAGTSTQWITIEWGRTVNPEHSVLLNLDHPFVKKHLNNDTLPIFIGFGVSLLYGEYKSLTLVKVDELRLLRQFTDKFMRYMASQTSTEIENDTED